MTEKQKIYWESLKGRTLSEEHKKKISDALKGKKPENFSMLSSSEVRKKVAMTLKNKPKSIEHRKNISLAKTGIPHPYCQDSKHPNWKGDDVSYHRIHEWKRNKSGHSPFCELCGIEGKYIFYCTKKGEIRKRWSIDWANKSRMYLRDLNDWLSLCIKCHRVYDKVLV